jgi:hypothetical protein
MHDCTNDNIRARRSVDLQRTVEVERLDDDARTLQNK